eukprot:85849_1
MFAIQQPISLNKHCISASITERYAYITYLFEFINSNNTSQELSFEITIEPDAFVSGFEANIDGQFFIGKVKPKEEAKQEYTIAKQKNENAILVSQPYDNISNIFKIQTNIDSQSKVILNIKIEQYLITKCNYKQLNIQILRDFNQYNIIKKYENIFFKFDIQDNSGVYDIIIPSSTSISYNLAPSATSNLEQGTQQDITITNKTTDKLAQNCSISGVINRLTPNINELILKYKTKGEANDATILYDTHSKTFCHIISNIINSSDLNLKDISIPRRVVFVIDKSGSMAGSKWNKTISATIKALQ